MKFIILGLLLIIFIAFCVMVWKAAQNWRWYHMVAAVITMILALVFLFPTAMSLKSRQAWHDLKEKLETQLEGVQEEHRLIMYGDPSDPSAPEGLADLNVKMSKIGIEAGRRWRNLDLQNADANSISLSKPAPPPEIGGEAPAADPAANEPLIPQELVVYGFAERNVANVDRKIPWTYLGEFRVTASSPTQVTLTPTGPLEAAQIQEIGSGRATSWSLYEMLPLDGHDPFVAAESQPSNDNVLGRVDDSLVRAILKDANPDTITKYLEDGKRDSPLMRQYPESRWVKIEFTKKHPIDVDSPQQVGALDGSFFDESGRSLDSRLQRGEGQGEITFAVGEILIVKEEAAKQLVDVEGVAKLIDTYYMRPLNDYRYVLKRTRLRITALNTRLKELEFERDQLQAAFDATQKMVDIVQIEKVQLEQDLAQTQIEKKAIGDYHNQLVEDVRKAKETLTRLYKNNHMREQELDRLHGQLK